MLTLLKETYQHPELGSYVGYGIRAVNQEETKVFRDLSTDREAVLSLIALLERNKASILHLEEIILCDALGVLL